MKTISIELAENSVCAADPLWWKRLMSLFLRPGRSFEIRHWREESEIIAQACVYGTLSEKDSTDFEVSVRGTLTAATVQAILHAGKPEEEGRMTAFFTICVPGVVSCSHYGREIYIFDPTEEIREQLSGIPASVRNCFLYGEYGE